MKTLVLFAIGVLIASCSKYKPAYSIRSDEQGCAYVIQSSGIGKTSIVRRVPDMDTEPCRKLEREVVE